VGPLDAFWHLLNLIGLPLALAAVAAMLAKLAWRRELRTVPLKRLVTPAAAAAVAATLASMLAFGGEGRMAGHGLVVAAAAAGLWWRAFGPGRR
jgi:hypothetical protein